MPGAAYLARLLASREKRAEVDAACCGDRREAMARTGGIATHEIDIASGEDKAVDDEASMPVIEFNWGDRRQGVRVVVQCPSSEQAIRGWCALLKAQLQSNKELLASGAAVSLSTITEAEIDKAKKIQSSLARRAKRRANRRLKYAKANDS